MRCFHGLHHVHTLGDDSSYDRNDKALQIYLQYSSLQFPLVKDSFSHMCLVTMSNRNCRQGRAETSADDLTYLHLEGPLLGIQHQHYSFFVQSILQSSFLRSVPFRLPLLL